MLLQPPNSIVGVQESRLTGRVLVYVSCIDVGSELSHDQIVSVLEGPPVIRPTRTIFTTTVIGCLLIAVFAAMAIHWVPSGPAAAHDQLISSTPTASEELDASPDEVTLEYSAEVMTMGAELRLTDSAGKQYSVDEAKFEGTRVVAGISEDLPDAAYSLAWRVVSSDGHPISGVVPFTVGDAPKASAEDTSAESSAPSQSAQPASEGADNAPSFLSWVRPVLVAVIGMGLAFGIFAFVTRTRKQRHND